MPQPKRADRRVIALIKLYEIADARLSSLIDQALRSGTAAQARYRRRVKAQIGEILRQLREEADPATKAAVRSAYDDGLILAHPNDGRRRALKGTFGGVHQQSVDVLVRSLQDSLRAAELTVGRRVDDVFRRETLRAVAEQLASGGARPEAARALETALRRQGNTAFVDKAGRAWNLSSYSGMAVRTTTREAMSTATKNRMLENGHDLVQIDKHPHVNDACSPYDGKVFSLTGQTPGYPVINQLPPFHPNCKHTAWAAKENFL
jgi:Phage minor capsid protein 2